MQNSNKSCDFHPRNSITDESEYTNVYINHKPASFDIRREFKDMGAIESIRDDGHFGFD
jgi:hypothetical protein